MSEEEDFEPQDIPVFHITPEQFMSFTFTYETPFPAVFGNEYTNPYQIPLQARGFFTGHLDATAIEFFKQFLISGANATPSKHEPPEEQPVEWSKEELERLKFYRKLAEEGVINEGESGTPIPPPSDE